MMSRKKLVVDKEDKPVDRKMERGRGATRAGKVMVGSTGTVPEH